MAPLPFLFLLCLPCVQASRVSVGVHNIETKHQNHYFELSCEKLHSRFLMRSNNLRVFVDSHGDSDDMGLTARAQAVMKSSAVLRTLRRAKDCPWVVVGNNEDLEAIGKVVSVVLAGNPCAPAALAELQLLDTDGVEDAMPFKRAMSILVSDTCEIDTLEKNVDLPIDVVDGDELEVEERVQDGVEVMLESDDGRMSLIQQSDAQRAGWAYVTKMIGALMVGVLFSLGCAWYGAQLGLWVTAFFGYLLVMVTRQFTTSISVMRPMVNVIWVLMSADAIVVGLSSAAMCGRGFFQVVNATSLLLDK